MEFKNLERHGWSFRLKGQGRGLKLCAPTPEAARAFILQYKDWISTIQRLWGSLEIATDEIATDEIGTSEIGQTFEAEEKLIFPANGVDLNELLDWKNPVYLTSMIDQKILWLNRAAMSINQIPRPGLLVGTNSAAMWGTTMSSMMDYLLRDREVIQFENIGFHWIFHEGNSLWRKRQVATVSNYRLIDWMGEPCRICETLSSEEQEAG